MTKKEFIWLGIRFFGVIYLLRSIPILLKFFAAFVSMGTQFIHPQHASGHIARWSVLGSLAEGLPTILLCFYLLFFGKWAFNIIARTSQLTDGDLLQKENYTEILIRFFGLRCIWSIFVGIIGVFIKLIMLAMIKVSPTLAEIANDPRSENHFKDMKMLLTLPGLLTILISILISALLAWYFLKNGKLFINFLNRLWLKAAENDLTRNPVSPV